MSEPITVMIVDDHEMVRKGARGYLDAQPDITVVAEAEFGAERRKFDRKKVTVPAKTVLKSGDNEQSVPGVLLDISMGGALLTYPKGSDVHFSSTGQLPQFQLCLEGQGSDKQICLDCESRYMRDTGNEIQVGASFTNLNEEEAEKLSRYVT